jgi:hypothetical protein
VAVGLKPLPSSSSTLEGQCRQGQRPGRASQLPRQYRDRLHHHPARVVGNVRRSTAFLGYASSSAAADSCGGTSGRPACPRRPRPFAAP